MKYFIDTEFLEGSQKTVLASTPPTIDLISIGIVAEDGREFYAVSKEFNLKEAWNRYDLKYNKNCDGQAESEGYCDFNAKDYWIRENVLFPIHQEWCKAEGIYADWSFTYKNFKKMLKKRGKSRKEIASEAESFCFNEYGAAYLSGRKQEKPEFWAYYADYDWVCFCWLFGKMIDLPKGFPMYCKDIQQLQDTVIEESWQEVKMSTFGHVGLTADGLKSHVDYPKNPNEHHALSDAREDQDVYNFLKRIQNGGYN